MEKFHTKLGIVRIASWGAAFCLAFSAQCEEINWFNVTFNDYAQGQVLSAEGATGGAWHSPIPNIATNVHDGVRNGIAITAGMGEELAFEPTTPVGRDIERIDFGLCAESL